MKYTAAPVINDRVVAVSRQIVARDGDAEYSPVLHVMISDMNLEDHWFDLDDPENALPRASYAKAEPWERAIFDALAALSAPERATAIAIVWGYLDETGRFALT